MREKRNIKKNVGFVLDESSSMRKGREQLIKAYNQQLNEIRKASDFVDTKFILRKFNDTSGNPSVYTSGIREIPDLDFASYMPRGRTALFDTIGAMVDDLRILPDADHPATSFLIVIFSDGQENHSRCYDEKDIAEIIRDLQDTHKWTFVYVGTEHNVRDQAVRLNIHPGNAMWFTKTNQGWDGMTRGSTEALSSYMTSAAGSTRSYYGQTGVDADTLG